VIVQACIVIQSVTGKKKLTEFQRKIAFFRHGHGVVHRLGTVIKELPHLLRGPEIELIGLKFHPVLVFDSFSGLDTQENLVRFGVRLIEVMAVVRRHQGYGQFSADLHQTLVGPPLVGNVVLHYFQIEISLPEDVPVFRRRRQGAIHVPFDDEGGDFAVETGTHADEPFVMTLQQLLVDAGTVVVAFPIAVGREFQ